VLAACECAQKLSSLCGVRYWPFSAVHVIVLPRPLFDQRGQGGHLTISAQACSASHPKADIRTAAQAHIATVRQANFAEVQLAIFSID
jgi:hypothetical protein